MKAVSLLLVVAVTAAAASVTAYHVEPRTAAMSGKSRPDLGVSQQVVACWDTLERIELFAGARGSGGVYTATVYEDGVPLMSSNGTQYLECSWVKFEDWNTQVAFTKGKTVTIRFTRSGNDDLEYYYQLGDQYPYGVMLVPGGPTPEGGDLAARVFGRMNPVKRADFGLCLPAFSEWYDPDSTKRAWGERGTLPQFLV